jgi:ESF2/ABP1 family protein
MAYEKALRDQRLRLEIGRAKKEANFYSSMIERSIHKKVKNDHNSDNNDKRSYKQRITDEEIRNKKSNNNNNNNEIDFDLLNKIFS